MAAREASSGTRTRECLRRLPPSWERAEAALAEAAVLPEYLGAAFCRLYRACRAAERARFEAVVTPLEHIWYLRAV